MKMGNSMRVYEIAEGWGKLPPHIKFGYTHGIVVDSKDNVYVFHTEKHPVVVFDREGNFLSSWGEELFDGGAHGFYLHSENGREVLYTTDVNKGRMVKTTLTGEVLLEIGTPDLPNIYDSERKFIPTDVCVAPNGDIYIADGYGQHYIHQYTADAAYIRSWGGLGNGVGEFLSPHGISVNIRSGEPELYIADRGNHRIQVFTLDGKHKRFIDNDMDKPDNFYFFDDELYFPDLNSRVTIFDKHDQLICHLGEDQQAYKQKGWPNLPDEYYRTDRFSSPHGVCVDSHGDVYVAEWTVNGRVTKLERVFNPNVTITK
ncbi:6-bladed beta-propeller [Paenibacillus contaminans]|uniref:6-bladed beta-propeller n=1 Tax=Paenibacillus contaminans TaxID=450362 RepID=A0A329M8A8_9BACL|nr:6-bladed beta-propeller [Paenibacillus contaminans]RAV14873.1 hypothetical protein DQG23_31065 [Paenibacillus contaminans]